MVGREEFLDFGVVDFLFFAFGIIHVYNKYLPRGHTQRQLLLYLLLVPLQQFPIIRIRIAVPQIKLENLFPTLLSLPKEVLNGVSKLLRAYNDADPVVGVRCLDVLVDRLGVLVPVEDEGVFVVLGVVRHFLATDVGEELFVLVFCEEWIDKLTFLVEVVVFERSDKFIFIRMTKNSFSLHSIVLPGPLIVAPIAPVVIALPLSFVMS